MHCNPIRPPIRPGEPLPWAIAHRGNSAEAPENTAAAFDAALEAPIDGIELDVQMSADGVPVIHHDVLTPLCAVSVNVRALHSRFVDLGPSDAQAGAGLYL